MSPHHRSKRGTTMTSGETSGENRAEASSRPPPAENDSGSETASASESENDKAEADPPSKTVSVRPKDRTIRRTGFGAAEAGGVIASKESVSPPSKSPSSKPKATPKKVSDDNDATPSPSPSPDSVSQPKPASTKHNMNEKVDHGSPLPSPSPNATPSPSPSPSPSPAVSRSPSPDRPDQTTRLGRLGVLKKTAARNLKSSGPEGFQPRIGRLGAIGRLGKGNVNSSQNEAPSSPTIGAEGCNSSKDAGEERQETVDERADRRRAELKVKLQRDATAGPAKKKRKL